MPVCAVLAVGLLVPVFALADHSTGHTIAQLQAQIQQLTEKIQSLQAVSPTSSSPPTSVGVPAGSGTVSVTPLPVPSIEPVQPIFDDDTSDDDIVQLNNLRIQKISSTRLPLVISASYDFGITCQKFETEGAGKGLAITCPASPTALYEIRVDNDTILLLRNRGRARITDFEIGDRINVYGFRDGGTGLIDALIVRNLDKPIVKQFIQLNNVEVVSLPSASRPPATLVVVQKGAYPCLDFGTGQETKSSAVFPCPLGIVEKAPTASSGISPELPPSYYRKYIIEVTSKTQILDPNRKSLALDKIQIGDTLNIYGSYTGDSSQISAQTIRDLSQSTNKRGTLQVTVSGSDIYCILQQTRDERAKPLIYPITTPCGILYDATVEVYDERGFVGKKTTARGVATFENLQFGNYTAVASAPGYERAKEALQIGAGKSPVVSITMTLQKISPPSVNQPPVISGVKGPTSLKVGETGTWSVSAYDPENGPLSYSVIWGDETPVVGGGGGSGAPLPLRSEISQTATFSHSYATAGMFTPTFTVTDNGNLSEKTSMSVNVGGVTPAPSITVLSPNGGEVWQKGTTQTINWKHKIALPECPIGASCPVPALPPVDIFLASWSPPCTTQPCPLAAAPTFGTFIAKGIDNDGAFEWSVGKNLAGTFIPDGKYIIIVSSSDANAKDQSDAPFSIVAGNGSADLVITDLRITPLSPAVNQAAKVNFSIKNIGTGSVINTLADFTVESTPGAGNMTSGNFGDGQTLNFVNTCPTNLSAGVSCGVSFDITYFNAGWKTFFVRADPRNQIQESDENNNSSSLQVNIVSTIQPSITVLSPNGGEVWQVGSTQKIIWKTSNISAPNDKITIYIAPAGDLSKNINLAQQIPNTGSNDYIVQDPAVFSYRSPLYKAGGQFQIFVCAQSFGNNDLCSYAIDYGDSPFSIVASSGLGATDSQQLASVLDAMRATLDQIADTIKTLR